MEHLFSNLADFKIEGIKINSKKKVLVKTFEIPKQTIDAFLSYCKFANKI